MLMVFSELCLFVLFCSFLFSSKGNAVLAVLYLEKIRKHIDSSREITRYYNIIMEKYASSILFKITKDLLFSKLKY